MRKNIKDVFFTKYICPLFHFCNVHQKQVRRQQQRNVHFSHIFIFLRFIFGIQSDNVFKLKKKKERVTLEITHAKYQIPVHAHVSTVKLKKKGGEKCRRVTHFSLFRVTRTEEFSRDGRRAPNVAPALFSGNRASTALVYVGRQLPAQYSVVGGIARLLKALRFFQKRRATPTALVLAPHLSPNAYALHAYAAGLVPRRFPRHPSKSHFPAPPPFPRAVALSYHRCTSRRTQIYILHSLQHRVSRTLWLRSAYAFYAMRIRIRIILPFFFTFLDRKYTFFLQREDFYGSDLKSFTSKKKEQFFF